MTNAKLNALIRARLYREYPDVAAALLKAWEIIRDQLSPGTVQRLVSEGGAELVIRELLSDEILDQALARVRQQLVLKTEQGFKYAVADLPKKGQIGGKLAVQFNVLNEKHVEAVRQMVSRVFDVLKPEVRDVVREHIGNGLRIGANPRETARHLRELIGLSPSQAQYVRNFADALRSGDLARVRGYGLLDKRFSLENLTPEKIDRIVDAYRKAWIASHANTVSRSATMQAMRVGNRLTWIDAMDRGVVPRGRVMKRWLHLDNQPDPRPHHVAMQGEVVHIESPYSNGDMHAGDGDPWNCHCQDVIFVASENSMGTAA